MCCFGFWFVLFLCELFSPFLAFSFFPFLRCFCPLALWNGLNGLSGMSGYLHITETSTTTTTSLHTPVFRCDTCVLLPLPMTCVGVFAAAVQAPKHEANTITRRNSDLGLWGYSGTIWKNTTMTSSFKCFFGFGRPQKHLKPSFCLLFCALCVLKNTSNAGLWQNPTHNATLIDWMCRCCRLLAFASSDPCFSKKANVLHLNRSQILLLLIDDSLLSFDLLLLLLNQQKEFIAWSDRLVDAGSTPHVGCFQRQAGAWHCKLLQNSLNQKHTLNMGAWSHYFIGAPHPSQWHVSMSPVPGFGTRHRRFSRLSREKVRMASPFPVTCFHVTGAGVWDPAPSLSRKGSQTFFREEPALWHPCNFLLFDVFFDTLLLCWFFGRHDHLFFTQVATARVRKQLFFEPARSKILQTTHNVRQRYTTPLRRLTSTNKHRNSVTSCLSNIITHVYIKRLALQCRNARKALALTAWWTSNRVSDANCHLRIIGMYVCITLSVWRVGTGSVRLCVYNWQEQNTSAIQRASGKWLQLRERMSTMESTCQNKGWPPYDMCVCYSSSLNSITLNKGNDVLNVRPVVCRTSTSKKQSWSEPGKALRKLLFALAFPPPFPCAMLEKRQWRDDTLWRLSSYKFQTQKTSWSRTWPNIVAINDMRPSMAATLEICHGRTAHAFFGLASPDVASQCPGLCWCLACGPVTPSQCVWRCRGCCSGTKTYEQNQKFSLASTHLGIYFFCLDSLVLVSHGNTIPTRLTLRSPVHQPVRLF